MCAGWDADDREFEKALTDNDLSAIKATVYKRLGYPVTDAKATRTILKVYLKNVVNHEFHQKVLQL